MLRSFAPLALLLVAAVPAAGRPRPHPAEPNDSAEACLDCHARATPAVVKEWEGSGHGLGLVKCFVCHGTTGADFRLAPDLAGCAGCHPAQAAAARPARKGAPGGCFTCHAPHALAPAAGARNPHAAK